jgi:hypothetical protein
MNSFGLGSQKMMCFAKIYFPQFCFKKHFDQKTMLGRLLMSFNAYSFKGYNIYNNWGKKKKYFVLSFETHYTINQKKSWKSKRYHSLSKQIWSLFFKVFWETIIECMLPYITPVSPIQICGLIHEELRMFLEEPSKNKFWREP